ncbi:glycoside hydrolase family 88/105 protein [Nitratireductor soli]|uniref:beta-galactosidase BglB n=1 Tax=Nitratireductor soli TaxID=1670619 RepID=UPI00065DDE9A|nr:glycoside hydrolase family 88 protein [Nitratireductor soli]
MAVSSAVLRDRLDLLVNGMTSLRHDGRFHEPNLDGTAGDYISFEAWEWPQGVGLYGLVQLWRQTRDNRLRALIEGWYAKQLAEGLPTLNINTTAPMLALSLLWADTRDERWREALDRWADRLMAEGPRTPEGGLQHDVSDKVNDNELWDDTLFMAGLFMASYGQASGRRELVDEAALQFLVHARYLSDTQTGLWFHGWTFDGRHNFARARWARGNAWITAGILDLFELADIGAPVKTFLSGVLRSQVSALLSLQAPSGAWRTLLDDPQSYEEISATAGFGYALLKGARLGFGDETWRRAGQAALAAVIANIDADGTVQNVSYGTRMGHDLQFYRDIPLQPTGYGQALAILCLVEGLHAFDAQEQAA